MSNSNTTTPSLDDILFNQYQLGRYHQRLSNGGNKRAPGGEITEAKAAILAAINRAKPSNAVIRDDDMGIDRARKSAANNAIDMFHQNLLKELGISE